MNLELRHLHAFVAVAETLNFSRAAARIHLSQSALSRTIQDLEERLACRLFDRRDGKVRLTEAGQAMVSEARAVMDRMQALRITMSSYSTGKDRTLTLAHFGTLIAVYLGPFLLRLQTPFPDVRIETCEMEPAEALEKLRSGQLDAVISGRPPETQRPGLVMREIYQTPPLIALPATHALAKRRRLRLAELAGEKWAIWNESRYPGLGKPFIEACRKAGFEPTIIKEIDSVAAVFDGVAQGRYLSYIGSLAKSLPQVGLVLVELEPNEIDMPIVMLWRPGGRETPVLEELAGMLIRAAPGPPAR